MREEPPMKIKLNKPFASNTAVDESDVRRIKKALNRLGYYQPYEKTGITGIPDIAVFTAVKKFQKDQGLHPTGMVKPEDETIKALSDETGNKKTGKYIWRTVGDERVRKTHAALNGTIRDYADSPDPMEEHNCRCWAEPLEKSTKNRNCREEIEAYIEAEKRVEYLSEKINDLLLRLEELRNENNSIVKKAQKNIGSQIVAFILTLPFDRIGVLGELLRKYFGNVISNELLQAADEFMRRLQVVKEKIQYTKDQITMTFALLERSAEELETSKTNLEECKRNENQIK